MKKYPLVVKFPKTRWPQFERMLVKSGKFQLPLSVTRKRLGVAYFYLVIQQHTRMSGITADNQFHYQTYYTADVTHTAPDPDLHTYLADNKLNLDNIEGIFALSPTMPER